jgi:hypothetical protein
MLKKRKKERKKKRKERPLSERSEKLGFGIIK